MMKLLVSVAMAIVLTSLHVGKVDANLDPSTGHMMNFGVTPAWRSSNTPKVVTKQIQVAECARNTRLHFPDVQQFAMFIVNHKDDPYHACPYGDCYAYITTPQPEDLVPQFTDAHLFFWNNNGGVPGLKVNAISDPQTGQAGYEDSLSGTFYAGKAANTSMQLGHDRNNPHFKEAQAQTKSWTPEGPLAWVVDWDRGQPPHPKCGLPCEPNKDPGQNPGFKEKYKPAEASEYVAPLGWKPTARDKCDNIKIYSSKGGNSGREGNATKTHGHQASPLPPPPKLPKPISKNASSHSHTHKKSNDTCTGSGTGSVTQPAVGSGVPRRGSCVEYCRCYALCQHHDDDCAEKCKNRHKKCLSPVCSD